MCSAFISGLGVGRGPLAGPAWGHLPSLSCQVLDKLLLYLRIVHSVDYYNTSEYINEDEMPNRCGIIHVRGPIPPNRVTHREGEGLRERELWPFGCGAE